MLTSLLIAVSVLGADPGIVFEGSDAPWAPTVFASRQALKRSACRDSLVLISSQTPTFSDAAPGPCVCDPTSPACDPAYPFYSAPQESPLQSWWQEFWHDPFVQEFMEGMNPFVDAKPHTIQNYYDPFGWQIGTGSSGRQGYRMGWVSYNDFTYLPSSAARGTAGSMQIVEWNSNLRYSHLIAPGVLFNGTGYFNARWWDGPSGTALPAQVDQISTDLELGFFNDGPWSGQVAFHPQIVETYEAKLDRNAFNFDGRAIATYMASPQWSFVFGFAIWNRVDTMFVPHAGVIWTPNNRWEIRLLYPRSRVSYFIGNRWNADFWVYGEAEYTAESWQSVDKDSPNINRMQITDDRLNLGIRWDSGRYSFFAEAGYVFNRQIKFEGPAPGFDLSDCVMTRVGLRY